VFTDTPFSGNQLAVFPDADGITEKGMQLIARELNLSETTFVLTPHNPVADYKVRIFTPLTELPMAGHPTIGTAFVMANEGKQKIEDPRINVSLEEKIGIVPVTVECSKGETGRSTGDLFSRADKCRLESSIVHGDFHILSQIQCFRTNVVLSGHSMTEAVTPLTLFR